VNWAVRGRHSGNKFPNRSKTQAIDHSWPSSQGRAREWSMLELHCQILIQHCRSLTTSKSSLGDFRMVISSTHTTFVNSRSPDKPGTDLDDQRANQRRTSTKRTLAASSKGGEKPHQPDDGLRGNTNERAERPHLPIFVPWWTLIESVETRWIFLFFSAIFPPLFLLVSKLSRGAAKRSSHQ
jgi:hypothetical protein